MRSSSPSTTITCGATIAPGRKRLRSPAPRANAISRPSAGAAASTRRSGASPSCSTGCGTIPRSARSSPPPWNIATWWRRCSAASPTPPRRRAACAPWATSGCGTPHSEACRPKSSSPPSILCSPGCAPSSPAAMKPPIVSPAIFRPNGPKSSACAPASPSLWELSTPTGTPSARACAWATWSTWWAPPPASWPSASAPN